MKARTPPIVAQAHALDGGKDLYCSTRYVLAKQIEMSLVQESGGRTASWKPQRADGERDLCLIRNAL